MSIGNVEERAHEPFTPVAALEIAAATPPATSARWKLLLHPELRRLVAYLVAGGLSALITISVTAVLTNQEHAGFFWAAVVGTELGILVNFSINDRLAFRDLEGKARPLPVRVLRFHVTCALGQTLILLISLLLHDVAHWNSVFAQALPIGVVTVVNFLMHRFWTYRGIHVRV
jgi:putative flippase GtrA